MDLLFKRYANPFLLFDNLIATGRFLEFILEFIDIRNEEKIYDYWLRKVFNKGFEEFKKQVMENNEIADVDNQNVETTINESMNILNNFNPQI
ncbi:hypothetical protein [Thomasclavelia ramosa]|uniref:Uncharacterized protein n=1 Tax=Thomasclavelia ramosa TaxID=1547 RepID=A0A3E3E9K9_9FIRM|nr:hypothetical protein [Thomasclavelia ramosa]RGD80343.1 hypothetical protein DXB93_15315 [Thomasclavelia ramosa]